MKPEPKEIDPLQLMFGASGPVLVVLLLLLGASLAVWIIWFLKTLQVNRLRARNRDFEREADTITNANDLIQLALRHEDAPGARIVMELAKRHHQQNLSAELLKAVARRAIATEEQRASSLMPTLASIASASPFVGLFGTVWGIMNAFIKIGVEKSASLPVVAPAIGEALIATAVGLVAAIPATIGYNYVDKRIGDFLSELSASSETWVETMAANPGGPTGAVPLVRPSEHPRAAGY
ncbi:MAG TPA: MotA/TolQ/ExbB proton channel family protein [Polyangiaceae bacterium]|nr:MotA/TolQ/ExbB proton channel family protein [Polyangiaceae bacterium]